MSSPITAHISADFRPLIAWKNSLLPSTVTVSEALPSDCIGVGRAACVTAFVCLNDVN